MKQALTEFFGTFFLLIIVVGSGIMGENLSGGNAAVTLLANSIVTAAGIYILIQCFKSISGAHFNPVVSLVAFFSNEITLKTFLNYLLNQFFGGIFGVWVVHIMFGLEVFQVSQKNRNQPNLWFSEFVATLGLLGVIHFFKKKNEAPIAIALYILAAYWFTSSTSFANPAVTLARSLTNTFCGIEPIGVIPFIGAQVLAALVMIFLIRTFVGEK